LSKARLTDLSTYQHAISLSLSLLTPLSVSLSVSQEHPQGPTLIAIPLLSTTYFILWVVGNYYFYLYGLLDSLEQESVVDLSEF